MLLLSMLLERAWFGLDLLVGPSVDGASSPDAHVSTLTLRAELACADFRSWAPPNLRPDFDVALTPGLFASLILRSSPFEAGTFFLVKKLPVSSSSCDSRNL